MTKYMTTDEVADHYRTTPSTVRWWRHVGRGPRPVKLGRRALYPLAEIERYDRELTETVESSTGDAA